jgi:hypothetical protein
MGDLEEKLKEILKPWEDEIVSEYGTGINDNKKPQFIALAQAIPAIKQAFKDAGWEAPIVYDKPPKQLFGEPIALDELKPMNGDFGLGPMYGQEFYNRFAKELDKTPTHIVTNRIPKPLALIAAKRAAGIEE